ncbi:MAG: UDP-N-acetylglucosamine 1-carboxyvinyltransferase [Christensenellaceae bacterium]|nr:UDP-N-acetylglucosamine 1-carboxyvinyltransferase [Christensenellaceae bacterium]
MTKLIINGGARLEGELKVQGAKNATLPILAAALLTEEPVIVYNWPAISDVYNMLSILEHIGAQVEYEKDRLVIDTRRAQRWEMPDRLAKEIRSSIFMIGPILARFRMARFTYPGGCEIGSRPIDLHLRGLKSLGVNVTESGGHIFCEGRHLRGGDIHLDYPSVGATENLMMAASMAPGQTVIHNAAREPEIIELQKVINQMGGKVRGAGTSTIRIEGRERLNGFTYTCIPDRIVAGTFMVAAVVTQGKITLRNVIPEHLFAITAKLREAGAHITVYEDALTVEATGRPKEMHLIETGPYPGFPPDMQAQMCTAASIARGTSIVVESVFDNRFKHVGELLRMGANIVTKNNVAVIKGVEKLHGAEVKTMDLRGGAALVLAGLCAEGTTIVDQAHIIDRGYQAFESELRMLGADIRRED